MFFELKCVLYALKTFTHHLRGKRVQVESDSEPAVRSLCSLFSERSACMAVVAEIRDFCALNFIIPRFEHIFACFNSSADALSHNSFDQAQVAFQREFGMSLMAPYRL